MVIFQSYVSLPGRACQLVYAAPSEYGHNKSVNQLHQQQGDETLTWAAPTAFPFYSIKLPLNHHENHHYITFQSPFYPIKIIKSPGFFARRLWDYLIGDPDNFKKNSFENRWRLNEMPGTGIQWNSGGLIRCF